MIGMTIGNLFNAGWRLWWTKFDFGIYGLLNNMYMLLFEVATAEIISGVVISRFFARIQLLIGIFMMFQLAMTVIKGIVSPDTFVNDKTGGGHVISRIVIALVLLALIVPINITSPRNEYEKQINNKGILFGTLDSLQGRILAQNTITKLVLGDSYGDVSSEDDINLYSSNPDEKYEGLKKFSNRFASSILRTFITFNTNNWTDDPAIASNRVCKAISDDVYNKYVDPDSSPFDILTLYMSETCTTSAGKEDFVFKNQFPFISSIIALVFVWLMLSMTFEVAVRAIKLAFLRLIAPIPIISYMDPKGTKDGAFTSWLKLLGTTYLDLFIKLAVIYFVMNIAMGLFTGSNGSMGLYVASKNWQLSSFVVLVIVISLFIFAKEADKFIKQALGLKDNGGKFFAAMGQAMGLGAVGLGAISGSVSNATAKYQAHAGEGRGKQLAYGILGGFTGFLGGGNNARKAWMSSKDGSAADVFKANKSTVQNNYQNGPAGFFGTAWAGAQNAVGLQNKYDRMNRKINAYESAANAWDTANSILDTDKHKVLHADSIATYGGKPYDTVKDLNDLLGRMKATGASVAEQEAVEEKIKHAKLETFRRIAGANMNDLDAKEQQIKQQLEIMVKTAGEYSGDADGIFAKYKGISSQSDLFAGGALGTATEYAGFNDTKFAFGNAKDRAKVDKNSAEYKKAAANAKANNSKN